MHKDVTPVTNPAKKAMKQRGQGREQKLDIIKLTCKMCGEGVQ
jgi:hypothetical protein